MNAFEQLIGRTFAAYRDKKIANLVFLYPPMRVAGLMRRVPCFIQAGKAPFDVAGIYYDKCGTGIGVELKETKDHEHSLAIVGPEKKGSGLQYHQLESLVEVYNSGGQSLLLWSNGGEIGLIRGDQIALVKIQYDASLRAEKANRVVPKGARSIPWGMFKKVEYGDNNLPLWLPPSFCQRAKKAAKKAA